MSRALFVTFISDMARPTGYRTRVLSEMEAVRACGVTPRLLALSPVRLVLDARARTAFARELSRRGLRGVLAPHPPALRTRAGRVLMLRVGSALVAITTRSAGAAVVHGHGPHAAACALGARRFSHAPVVFDAHGAAGAEFELHGRVRRMPQRRLEWEVALVRDLERRCWREADAVVAVSDALIEQFALDYGPRSAGNIVRVPCAVAPLSFADAGLRARVRKELGVQDRQVLVYVGSLASYQQAPEMLQLAAGLHRVRQSVVLLLISQAPSDEWHRLARAAGLSTNAYTVISAPAERVAELTSAGDVGLMLREHSPVNHVAFPTKLGEYLAAGVPVLTTSAAHDPAKLVARGCVGLVATDRSELETDRVLAWLDAVCAEREAWAERCQRLACEDLTWPRYAKILTELYSSVA